MSVLESIGAAMPGVGYLVGGLIASAIDPRATFLVAGIGVLAIVAVAALLMGTKWPDSRENTGPEALDAEEEIMVELIPVGGRRTPARSDSEVVSVEKAWSRCCWSSSSLVGSALGLTACGSSERQGGRHADRQLRLVPRLPRSRSSPTRRKAGRRCTTPTCRCSPTRMPTARRAARSCPASPRACPRSATAARPTR